MVVLILEANCTQKEWIFNGEKILVKRSQLITSLDILKGKIGKGVKVGQVRTALKNLKKYGFIASETTNTGRLITVLNYDKYQVNNSTSSKVNDKDIAKGKQSSNKEPAPNNNDNKENKEINTSSKKVFGKDSIEYRLSNLLYQKILENNSNFKEPDLGKWAKHIDSMIRIDKRNPDDIKKVINWAQSDSFWKSNILSTQKLRRQFDQLFMKSKGEELRLKNDKPNDSERKRNPEEWKKITNEFYGENL